LGLQASIRQHPAERSIVHGQPRHLIAELEILTLQAFDRPDIVVALFEKANTQLRGTVSRTI
jgi:hypothetical protein